MGGHTDLQLDRRHLARLHLTLRLGELFHGLHRLAGVAVALGAKLLHRARRRERRRAVARDLDLEVALGVLVNLEHIGLRLRRANHLHQILVEDVPFPHQIVDHLALRLALLALDLDAILDHQHLALQPVALVVDLRGRSGA